MKTYLERFKALEATQRSPELFVHEFLGWICTSAERQRSGEAEHITTQEDVERFLAAHEPGGTFATAAH